MRRLLLPLCTALLLVAAATAAQAQIDVEIAFDPAVVDAGGDVTLFTSIENLGNEAVDATLEVTFAVDSYVFGPFTAVVPLAAGELLSHEFTFTAPLLPVDVMLTIDVVATAGEFTDADTATLTITGTQGGTASSDAFEGILQAYTVDLSGSTVGANAASLSDVKKIYR
ncbi:MAG: hypothetical protein R6X25_06645 [Candidatus Krumholzibacteriia bacterium]